MTGRLHVRALCFLVLTIFFGWCLLGEPLLRPQVAGAALVLGGVWLGSRR